MVAPNGTVYRDDDSGGSNRPLVRINGTPNNGWYTVSINNWNGAAVSQNFTVTLQRLGLNGAGCLPATGPTAAATASAAAKSAAPVAAPKAGDAAVEAGLDDPAGRTPRLTAGRPLAKGRRISCSGSWLANAPWLGYGPNPGQSR